MTLIGPKGVGGAPASGGGGGGGQTLTDSQFLSFLQNALSTAAGQAAVQGAIDAAALLATTEGQTAVRGAIIERDVLTPGVRASRARWLFTSDGDSRLLGTANEPGEAGNDIVFSVAFDTHPQGGSAHAQHVTGTTWRLLLEPTLVGQSIDPNTLLTEWNTALDALQAGFRLEFNNSPPALLPIRAADMLQGNTWELSGGVDPVTAEIVDNVGLVWKAGRLVPSVGGGQRMLLGSADINITDRFLAHNTNIFIPIWANQLWVTFGRESTSATDVATADVFEISLPTWRGLRQLEAREYGEGDDAEALNTSPSTTIIIPDAMGQGNHDAYFMRGETDELLISSSGTAGDFLPLTVWTAR